MARAEREKRFISEYCKATFAPGQYVLNVELGKIPTELVEMEGIAKARVAYRPWRRRIDAVAWDDTTYKLIEAKIRDPFEGLGRLHSYYTMALDTTDLPGYEGQTFEKVLVVPFALEWIKAAAIRDNTTLVEFWADWIADYIKERQEYFTAEYRATRNEKMRLRELMGLD